MARQDPKNPFKIGASRKTIFNSMRKNPTAGPRPSGTKKTPGLREKRPIPVRPFTRTKVV